MPALLTSTSRRPKVSTVFLNSAMIASSLVRSAGSGSASPPLALMPAATSANSSAMPRPMPLLAPVTIAILPWSCPAILYSRSRKCRYSRKARYGHKRLFSYRPAVAREQLLGQCPFTRESRHRRAPPACPLGAKRRHSHCGKFIRSPRRRAVISLPEKAQPSERTWHELRLLLVPVQGGKGAHPRQRRAEPVLPAWDEITALAQDSYPYHVGRLLPLPRRCRIDR